MMQLLNSKSKTKLRLNVGRRRVIIIQLILMIIGGLFTSANAGDIVDGRVLITMKTATSKAEAQSQLDSPDVTIGLMLSL